MNKESSFTPHLSKIGAKHQSRKKSLKGAGFTLTPKNFGVTLRNKGGFTLIELLIIVAIIVIIAGAILIVINPIKRIAEAKDAQRWVEVRSILEAANTIMAENMAQPLVCFKGQPEEYELPADDFYRWIGPEGGGGTWLCDYELDDSSSDVNFPEDNENGYDGFCYSGKCPSMATDRFGALSAAYQYDGTDDNIKIADVDSVFYEAPFSVSLWFKLNQLPVINGDDAYLISAEVSGDPFQSWIFWVNDQYEVGEEPGHESYIGFTIRDSSRGTHVIWSNDIVDTVDWYYVVATVDKDYNMKMYVNGDLQNDIKSSGSMYAQNIDTLRIGSSSEYNSVIDGILDEVAFFDYVMTADDVKTIYNNKIGGKMLHGYQKCDLYDDLLSGGYFSSIPLDPDYGDENNSGYLIKSGSNGIITVKAPYASEYAEDEIKAGQ